MNKYINVDAFIADCKQRSLKSAYQVYFELSRQSGIDIVRCRECIYRNSRRKCPMRVFTGDNGFCSCGKGVDDDAI